MVKMFHVEHRRSAKTTNPLQLGKTESSTNPTKPQTPGEIVSQVDNDPKTLLDSAKPTRKVSRPRSVYDSQNRAGQENPEPHSGKNILR